MQFPHDWFAKGILLRALEGVREIHLGEQVTPEVLALDAWIEPRAGVPDDHRGLLARMTREPCVVEPYQPRTRLADLDQAMLRVTVLHNGQKAKVPQPATGKRVLPPRPVLYVVSPERCERVLREWLCLADRKLGPGFYRSRVRTRGPRVVVVAELPRTPETLLLRMMGRGPVLQDAIDDVRALPVDAWERAVVQPLLERLRADFERRGIVLPTQEGNPMLIDYKALQTEWDDTVKRIRDEGRNEGRNEGLGPTLCLFELRLSRPLTDTERAAVSARLDVVGPKRLGEVVLTLPADALAVWITDPDAR